jgi:hypothetical protein
MGLAVAAALSQRGDWNVHILDLNVKSGEAVAAKLANTTFHKADVVDYDGLAATFKTVFISSGKRLDFVFGNAGVIEKRNFYAKHNTGDEPPPTPDLLSVDVDLKGVINTSYLALHYFRQSPHKGQDASLVLTASCGSFYPSDYSPVYTAAKRKPHQKSASPEPANRLFRWCHGFLACHCTALPSGWHPCQCHLPWVGLQIFNFSGTFADLRLCKESWRQTSSEKAAGRTSPDNSLLQWR